MGSQRRAGLASSSRPAGVAAAVAGLRDRQITTADKGFGPLAAGGHLTAGQLSAQRPQLHAAGLSYPLLTLRESALRHNIQGMASYCAAAGVELAPHGKTTMAPQIAACQLAAGAWGITVATIGQLQVYRAFGFTRLLLANALVDPAGIGWLAAALAADPDFTAYCYVDSIDGVHLLDSVLRDHPAAGRLPVLVELGHAGGRTGTRTVQQGIEVALAAASTATLRVAGVAGYEGSIGDQPDEPTLSRVAAYCADLRELALALDARGMEAAGQILSAGGSAFFDVVVRELTTGWTAGRPEIVLRSGSYVSHDHGFYAAISPAARGSAGGLSLRPALELWAAVLSRPEPELALLCAGRRDVSFDAGLPVPLRVRHRDGSGSDARGMRVTALNDQHAFLQVPPGGRLAPGDLVGLGISHPCTTFDKWRVIPVVDDADALTNAVHTFF